MLAHDVVVYAQPGRGPCHADVEFLSQSNVAFTEKNIRADPNALQELLRMNSQSTPTTFRDGEVITGFAWWKLSALLGL